MSLTTLDFLVIVAYLLGMAAIGLYFSKRQTSRDEYFLGGRRTHWLLAGGSILATLLSSISYLSLPGEMIRYGFGFFAGVLGVPLVVPLMNYTLLPAIKRPADHQCVRVPGAALRRSDTHADRVDLPGSHTALDGLDHLHGELRDGRGHRLGHLRNDLDHRVDHDLLHERRRPADGHLDGQPAITDSFRRCRDDPRSSSV